MARMQDCTWQPRHSQSQGSVERVNKEIKKVLGSLIKKTKSPELGELSQQYSIFYQHQPTFHIRIQNTVQSFAWS